MEFLKDIDNIYKKFKMFAYFAFVAAFFGGGYYLIQELGYEGSIWEGALILAFFAILAGG